LEHGVHLISYTTDTSLAATAAGAAADGVDKRRILTARQLN